MQDIIMNEQLKKVVLSCIIIQPFLWRECKVGFCTWAAKHDLLLLCWRCRWSGEREIWEFYKKKKHKSSTIFHTQDTFSLHFVLYHNNNNIAYTLVEDEDSEDGDTFFSLVRRYHWILQSCIFFSIVELI